MMRTRGILQEDILLEYTKKCLKQNLFWKSVVLIFESRVRSAPLGVRQQQITKISNTQHPSKHLPARSSIPYCNWQTKIFLYGWRLMWRNEGDTRGSAHKKYMYVLALPISPIKTITSPCLLSNYMYLLSGIYLCICKLVYSLIFLLSRNIYYVDMHMECLGVHLSVVISVPHLWLTSLL